MLKFELDEYNPWVLRHIGNALVSIAADRESERGKAVTECTAGRKESVTFGPTPTPLEKDVVYTIAPFSPESVAPPAPPVDVIQTYETASPVLPPPAADEDDDFPNPPSTVPAPPAADVAPPPPPAAGPELDSAGIPWDARIHAATKTKCKDGSWKNKPGVDAALLASVTAELKGVQALPVPPAPAATVPPAPLAATVGPTTFAELMKELTPLLVPGGKLTAQQVNEACQVHGLPNCGALGARPDLIPTVWSQLCLILS